MRPHITREIMKRRRDGLRGTLLRSVGIVLAAALLIACALLAIGCGRQEAQLSTGKIVRPTSGYIGDTAYAEVRYDALPAIYDEFRIALSQVGIVRWDERFDCNGFAEFYVGVAKAKFSTAAWHSSTEAQSLALAQVWYRRDAGGRHAIVKAITDRGTVFIEPQTGKEIALSVAEQRSINPEIW